MIGEHQKQVAENNKIKEIILDFMEKDRNYILTDLYFDILPLLGFCRKRVTIQRITALMLQLRCYGEKIKRKEIGRNIYYIKL